MQRAVKFGLNFLLTLTSLAYPLIWLWATDTAWLFYLPYLMAALWFGKAWFGKVFLPRQPKSQVYFAWFMALLLTAVGITRSVQTMYWYPVLINGVMLALFGSSLWAKQTLVERFARLQTPNLSTAGVHYTKRVTQLWCGVFLVNILIATGLIWLEYYNAWAIFTGVISYLIIAVVMATEWLVRQRVKSTHATNE